MCGYPAGVWGPRPSFLPGPRDFSCFFSFYKKQELLIRPGKRPYFHQKPGPNRVRKKSRFRNNFWRISGPAHFRAHICAHARARAHFAQHVFVFFYVFMFYVVTLCYIHVLINIAVLGFLAFFD